MAPACFPDLPPAPARPADPELVRRVFLPGKSPEFFLAGNRSDLLPEPSGTIARNRETAWTTGIYRNSDDP
jgi:hypothetical protein